MAKTKEERAANRAKRKNRKKVRKEKFTALLKMVNETPEPSDNDFLQDPKEKFQQYWPVLHAVLDFAVVLKVTRKKVDKVILRIIDVGNKMYDGTAKESESAEFIKKLQKVWGIARKALSVTTIVTDDKTDETIEKAIAIGDWISSVDEDDED